MIDRTKIKLVRTTPVNWDDLWRQASPIPKQKARLYRSTFINEWVLEPQGPNQGAPCVIVVEAPPFQSGETEVRIKNQQWEFYR